MKQKLDRTLGMYSSLMISIGTMIGSAIFFLAGTSYQVAGPAASLAIFLAGIAAVFTGFSFAELVTVVPKAGGGYVYVKEATGNNIIGFICGWGFWLGYAMSCGLFALGFGNFIYYIFQQIFLFVRSPHADLQVKLHNSNEYVRAFQRLPLELQQQRPRSIRHQQNLMHH